VVSSLTCQGFKVSWAFYCSTSNNHKEAAEKKNALDDAFKCIQHCEKYFLAVPVSDSFEDVKRRQKRNALKCKAERVLAN